MMNDVTDTVDAILHAYQRGKAEGYADGYSAACDELENLVEEEEGVDVDDPDGWTPAEYWQLGYNDGWNGNLPQHSENEDYRNGYNEGEFDLGQEDETQV